MSAILPNDYANMTIEVVKTNPIGDLIARTGTSPSQFDEAHAVIERLQADGYLTEPEAAK